MNNSVIKLNTSLAGVRGIGSAKSGFMIGELILALIVLSFIVHPTFVETENEWGERTTKVEWELPMAKLLAQVGDFKGLIDKSWAGLDRQFGYTGPSMGERAGALMVASLENGVTLMTGGFVDSKGRFTGDFSNNVANFQKAAEGMSTAYYVAAMDGMRRQ